MIYEPVRWVLLRFDTPQATTFKVFGGWYGGYLDGDRWKLSSGVTGVVWENGAFTFSNVSGSDYICQPSQYGMTAYMEDVFAHFEKQMVDSVGAKMTTIPLSEVNEIVFHKLKVFL